MKTTIDVSELQQAWLSSASQATLFEGGDLMENDTLAMEEEEEQATDQLDFEDDDAEAANMNVERQEEDDGEMEIEFDDPAVELNQPHLEQQEE